MDPRSAEYLKFPSRAVRVAAAITVVVVTQLVDKAFPTDAEKSVPWQSHLGDEESWVRLYWSPGGPVAGGSDAAGDSEDFVAWTHAIVPGELESRERRGTLVQP